jgi:hypothetical protein
MMDFSEFPKQWVISKGALPDPVSGKSDMFRGWEIQAGETVPLLRLTDPDGAEVGRLVGWVVEGDTFHDRDGVVALAPGEDVEALYARLSGRFALIWEAAPGDLRLRIDVSGGLPAIVAHGHGVVAATTSLIAASFPLETDADIEAIFSFPKNRGFLPFGLTASKDVTRLLPSHEVRLSEPGLPIRRIWPGPDLHSQKPVSGEEARALAREAAGIVRCHVHAIIDAAPEPTILYLSGGVDSRMILAATKGREDRVKAETIGTRGNLDVHLAVKLAEIAGIPHRIIAPMQSSPEEIRDWIHRAGHTIYDPVSDLAATVHANPPDGHALTGTGCDISKGKHFEAEDIGRPDCDVDLLLYRLRMPEGPRMRAAAGAWLNSFDGNAATWVLDIAKIEQIYGCWSSVSGYGHKLTRPSISPFSSRRLMEIVLALPMEYRRDKGFFKDFVGELWPELLALPVNRAAGLDRVRFLKTELRSRVPNRIKRLIKPFR